MDVEHVADLPGRPLVLRVHALGLPPLSDTYAEELLETVWRGVALVTSARRRTPG